MVVLSQEQGHETISHARLRRAACPDLDADRRARTPRGTPGGRCASPREILLDLVHAGSAEQIVLQQSGLLSHGSEISERTVVRSTAGRREIHSCPLEQSGAQSGQSRWQEPRLYAASQRDIISVEYGLLLRAWRRDMMYPSASALSRSL